MTIGLRKVELILQVFSLFKWVALIGRNGLVGLMQKRMVVVVVSITFDSETPRQGQVCQGATDDIISAIIIL
jgi:hypothetical protein